MNRKLIAGFILVSFLAAPALFAAVVKEEPSAIPVVADGKQAVEAGNKMCPISGEAVNPEVSYTYNGKVYHFCCAGCIEKFKADPETYIAKLAKEGNG